MAAIFINYRHADTWATAKILSAELASEFGKDETGNELVFFDYDKEHGKNPWKYTFRAELERASVLLILIGKHWDTERLHNKNDDVRWEVEFAKKNKIPCIPVLVDLVEPPAINLLPKGPLQKLYAENIETLRRNSFKQDVEQIILRVHRIVERPIRVIPEPAEDLVVLRYEITGLAEAVANKELWDKRRKFEEIAPALLLETRWDMERSLAAELRRRPECDTFADGALFFIHAGKRTGDTVKGVCKVAREVVDRFLDRLRKFAPQTDQRGLDWTADIRIAITEGMVSTVRARGTGGEQLVERAGSPINAASLLLQLPDNAHRDRSLVRRGEIGVLTTMTNLALEGFEKLELPLECRPEGTSAPIDRNAAFGSATAWRSRRAPVTDHHFRIQPPIVKILKRHTLTTDEKAEDLRLHVPPKDYPEIAKKAKTGARFCIIVGPPGTGKTLCGLRLAAEMMHIDGLEINVPPVATETWEELRKTSDPDRVWFLDDAFGKTKVLQHSELRLVLDALGIEPEDSESVRPVVGDEKDAEEDAGTFLALQRTKRPALIITVRRDIWEDACKLDSEWDQRLHNYTVYIGDNAYSREALIQIFDTYLAKEKQERQKSISSEFETLRDSAIKEIVHPLSIRDFIQECGTTPLGAARNKIKDYKGNALERYIGQLRSREPAGRVWHFLAWVYGGAMLRKTDVKQVFQDLRRGFVLQPRQEENEWEEKGDTKYWGAWDDNGYFSAAHPLREEAIERHFSDPAQQTLVDRYFEGLLGIQGTVGDGAYSGLALAAFATPKVPGQLGPHREAVVARAGEMPESVAAILLASSIGRTFRDTAERNASAVPDFSTRRTFVRVLEKLLTSIEYPAFGAAIAALCDSIPRSGTLPQDLRPLAALAVVQLRTAVSGQTGQSGVLGHTGSADLTRVVIQNIDQSAWAIASNFSRLTSDFHSVLLDLVEMRGNDWIRLRALEAAADYISVIRSATSATHIAAKLESAITAAVATDQPDILRRGVAGAIEANMEDLSSDENKGEKAYDTLIDWLESNSERYNFALLEWAIWAIGKHLSELLGNPNLFMALWKVARHENARVRKWLATALAESEATEENDTLRAIITRLARDEDDGVRSAAMKFFLKRS